MIKVRDDREVYNIPSSWSDVTYGQQIKLQSVTDEKEILSILCNIPMDKINRLSEKSVINLSAILSFVSEPIQLEGLEAPKSITTVNGKKVDLVEDIKVKTFGQKIYIHSLLKDNEEKLIEILPDIVAVYSQEQITGKDFDINKINELKNEFNNVFLVDLYSTAMSYITQLKSILETEQNALHKEPTYEQKKAGVDMFNDFGVMNTIKALAGGDILKYEAVTKIEYNIVFTHMAMNKVQSEFEENYRKVLKQTSRR